MSDKLNRHALILNKNWVVIGTTTVRDAIILMSKGSAKGVCTQSFSTYTWDNWLSSENPPNVDFYIQSPSMQIPAPQIILLINYDDVYHKSIKFSQRAVYKRDNYTCGYCRKKFKISELSIDHIIPRSKNGKTSWENCITACFTCNNKKSNQTPEEAGLKLIKLPTKPTWNPVFHVNDRPVAWKPLIKEGW